MKQKTRLIQPLGEVKMLQVLRISLLAISALFMTGGFAQSFNGFASYQDYLNNYYNNPNVQQSPYQTPTYQAPVYQTPVYQNPTPIRAVTYTPYTAPVQNTNTQTIATNAYNGFASYQDYLDNFYAGQNVPAPTVDPCGFAQTMSIFVSPNNDCAPVNTVTPTRTTTTTTAFNGYPSYEAYLEAFYAGTTTSTGPSQQTTPAVNTSVTSGYYGYNSYEEYLQAFYALNNTSAPTTTNPTAPAGGYDVSYTVTQTGNQAPPRTDTQVAPSTNVSGYFDFVIGQAYEFSNGLIMTVESLSDNRCPQGVQCVWQGDIAAVVRLEKDDEDQRANVSIVQGRQAPQIVVDNASIQFVGLGEKVDNEDTLATYIIIN